MTEQEVKDSEDYQYLLTTKDYPDYWAYDEDITNITADGTSWRLSWSVPNFDKENDTTTDTCEYIIPFCRVLIVLMFGSCSVVYS